MGCFWGAERLFWQLPGVYSTAAGYAGGTTPNPTYEETCTSMTGHTEAVLVVFDPNQVALDELMKVFWENHDPTQYMGQGGDIGSQYRSAVYANSADQLAAAESTRDTYQAHLTDAGYGENRRARRLSTMGQLRVWEKDGWGLDALATLYTADFGMPGTIRLDIENRRGEIEVTKLVGGSDAFVVLEDADVERAAFACWDAVRAQGSHVTGRVRLATTESFAVHILIPRLLVPLLILWIGVLALSHRGVSRFLATDTYGFHPEYPISITPQ